MLTIRMYPTLPILSCSLQLSDQHWLRLYLTVGGKRVEQPHLAPISCLSAVFPFPNYLLKIYVINSIHQKANCGMQATEVIYELCHPIYRLEGFIWFLHQASSSEGKTKSTKQLVSQVSVPLMGPEQTSQWCALALKPDYWEHNRIDKTVSNYA